MPDDYTPRRRTLTDADLHELAQLLRNEHQCRFNDVTPDDLSFVKDLINIYKETRSEIIKWLVKGLIYASLMAVAAYAWLKYGGKH
jgi:hypothetical protein